MYDFNKHLTEKEKILYEGRPVPGTGDKSVGGQLFIIIFISIMQALMIWSVKAGIGDGANGINISFIVIFSVTLLFDGIAIYSLVYNLFLKKRQVSDDFYCITNKRVLKYEQKKDKLIFGYIANYDDIRVINTKNKYGDLYMGIVMKESGDSSSDLENVKNIMLHPNPENMPNITFESISAPGSVLKIVKEAKNNLQSQ